MKLVPPAVIETITVPVIKRGRWIYLLDRNGHLASRGIDPNRIAPLGEAQVAAIRWRHTAIICRSRLRSEAVHFSVRGPWEARAYALQCWLRQRAQYALRARSSDQPRKARSVPRPATWPAAADVMLSRISHDEYRNRPWTRWRIWAGQAVAQGYERTKQRCRRLSQ